MRRRPRIAAALLAVASAAAAGGAGASDWAAEDRAIREVVAGMQAAWNRGDFEGYMQGFLNPGVVFVSRGRFQRDWQGTLDHYVADYGSASGARGTLCFYDIRIEPLAGDAAQLVSRYHLAREAEPQYGINTRLMRKVDGRWVIALNHVSSVDTPDSGDRLLATDCRP
ncbi:nuclear transport factor 2 family protein [Luteimonas sp. Y-2-2-4F]|nr:nuclear transport factor 2 family protein [Luteimonas sp. Y-2-2-4F]MCD9031645.1 nuclear transport factor 2 family protein [Luteimonas sp. Y-2-2-4F]MCD9031780.1 nuclear transport factor 2 family protein [Luteimonas sp. Y-2-2-4F]